MGTVAERIESPSSPHALRRPSPHVQLRHALQEAKARALTFDDAWAWAMRQIIWPHDTTHRQQWRRALLSTRSEWRACYCNEPTRAGRVMRDFRPEVVLGERAA